MFLLDSLARSVGEAITQAPGFLNDNLTTLVVSSIVVTITVFLAKLFGADSSLDVEDAQDKEETPRPKWEVLSVLNYIFLTVFVVSITFTIVNWRSFGPDEITGQKSHNIFPHFCLWCVCMAYFFGFFGISFLDKTLMPRSSGDFPLPPGYAPAPRPTPVDAAPVVKPTPRRALAQHKPFNDTPICAERGFTKPAPPVVAAPKPATAAPGSHGSDFAAMSDEQVLSAVAAGLLKDHELEKRLKDCSRAVRIRRAMLEGRLSRPLTGLPCDHFDYSRILGANCEIVIGYVPVPVGVVGPLLLDGKLLYVPMATTEGCLVASTNRGCKALTESGGAFSVLLKDGMTRAPLIRMPTAAQAAQIKRFVEDPEGFALVKEAFESTTAFGKLRSVNPTLAGRNVFLRFVCHTGDAMGMNMISKGCLRVMELLEARFPDMELVSISGNMCTDKKPAAVNWIEGRGKSVVVEAFIPAKVVSKVLKTSVQAIVDVNKQKNLVGSAMAGSVGGFNAHAANIVAAVFLATGQDIAQVVESANCITLLEEMDGGEVLHVSVTMPSIEVGTVGGGTGLEAQGACLDIVGVRGASKPPKSPGENAQQLAKVVGCAVMAGELSLLAALAANHLVKSHMEHNRKAPAPAPTSAPAPAPSDTVSGPAPAPAPAEPCAASAASGGAAAEAPATGN